MNRVFPSRRMAKLRSFPTPGALCERYGEGGTAFGADGEKGKVPPPLLHGRSGCFWISFSELLCCTPGRDSGVSGQSAWGCADPQSGSGQVQTGQLMRAEETLVLGAHTCPPLRGGTHWIAGLLGAGAEFPGAALTKAPAGSARVVAEGGAFWEP